MDTNVTNIILKSFPGPTFQISHFFSTRETPPKFIHSGKKKPSRIFILWGFPPSLTLKKKTKICLRHAILPQVLLVWRGEAQWLSLFCESAYGLWLCRVPKFPGGWLLPRHSRGHMINVEFTCRQMPYCLPRSYASNTTSGEQEPWICDTELHECQILFLDESNISGWPTVHISM